MTPIDRLSELAARLGAGAPLIEKGAPPRAPASEPSEKMVFGVKRKVGALAPMEREQVAQAHEKKAAEHLKALQNHLTGHAGAKDDKARGHHTARTSTHALLAVAHADLAKTHRALASGDHEGLHPEMDAAHRKLSSGWAATFGDAVAPTSHADLYHRYAKRSEKLTASATTRLAKEAAAAAKKGPAR